MSLEWFPIILKFHLRCQCTKEDVATTIQAAFPGLNWGVEADLLQAKTEWPEAVLEVSDLREQEYPDGPTHYPVTVEFLVFPKRETGQHDIMLPTSLALLRDLALRFECPVLSDASNHHPAPPRDPDDPYRGKDIASFLMHGGSLYTTAWSRDDIHTDATTGPGGWLPVSDVPYLRLDDCGCLTDPAMIETYKVWRANRRPPTRPQQTHASSADPRPRFGHIPLLENGTAGASHIPSPEPAVVPVIPHQAEPAVNSSEPSGIEEHIKMIDAYVAGRGPTSAQLLIKRGISLPAPDAMDDATLSVKLAEVIDGLAAQHTTLEHTNHLSDRELYTHLWRDSLNGVYLEFSDMPGTTSSIDILGSWDEEDMRIYLLHYANGSKRAREAAHWPDMELLAHVPLPFDRDPPLPSSGE